MPDGRTFHAMTEKGTNMTIQDAEDARPVIQRVSTVTGDPAWWVTGYDEVKELLLDRRLGRSHPEPERAARFSHSVILAGPEGDDPAVEPVLLARWRRHMAPLFTSRRMSDYAPRVRQITEELVDAMLAAGSPADLHEAVTLPLSSRVMCELLGVPQEDHEDFWRWSDQSVDLTDPDLSLAGVTALWEYMRTLIERKRKQPGDDAISHMLATSDHDPDFTSDDIAMMSAKLLFAGYEQTATVMDNAVLLLITHPDQYTELRRDRAGLEPAMEELLRQSLPVSGGGGQPEGVCRYAHQDVSVDGVSVDAGELLLLDLRSANWDARTFTDPDTLDLARTPNPHLSFGYGSRFCIGAPLARIEMRSVLTALFDRMPVLRLAVPAESLRHREGMLIGGLEELPVAW